MADCRWWAHTQRECTTNARWMDYTCPSACGACLGGCEDIDKSCRDWAEKGECDQNARFMIDTCPSSCDLCPRLRGAGLECDTCLAVVEAIWTALQPQAHLNTDFDVHVGSRMGTVRLLDRDEVRHRIAFLCDSYEWVSEAHSHPHQKLCEEIISTKFDAIEAAFLEAMQPPDFSNEGTLHPLADQLQRFFGASPPPPPPRPAAHLYRPSRAMGLRLKRELCAGSAHVEEHAERVYAHNERMDTDWRPHKGHMPIGLGTCNAQRGRTMLGIGAPPLRATTCDACRAYVRDAVTMLRRGGHLLKPAKPPEDERADRRNALTRMDNLCANLELRHNVSDGAARELVEKCDAMVREHSSALHALTYQWARPDVVELACVESLKLCDVKPTVMHEEL